MTKSQPGHRPVQKVFLFGPQALAFDINSFKKLRNHLYEALGNRWALDSISELPNAWGALVKSVPTLQHWNGEQLLQDLGQALQTGNISESLFPLPNILLCPLTVIAQLTQYSATLRAAVPDLADTDELPESITDSTETLGLCIGILSAFAVGYSSSLAELQYYSAVAVRLAMLAGALSDAEESLPDSDGSAMSFSVSWKGAGSIASVNEVLERFPDAYVSIFVDETRSTVTASKKTAPVLIEQLKLSGVRIADVALSGRFHWLRHQEDAENLMSFCGRNPEFQFPDASMMVLPSRIGTEGEYLSSGSPHEIALREILVKPAQWFSMCSHIYSSQLSTNDATVICFGPERCVPPTIAKRLGSHLAHISDINLSTSMLRALLLGQSSTPPFEDLPDDRIAVIGMSCHVPGAEDLEGFWRILASGQSQHTEVPSERFSMQTAFRELESNRKWYGNFIQDYDAFDHKFFKKSPREMASTDPQHRLILQLAYQAVEQSGYFGVPNFNKHIGCYVGVGNVDYDRNIACHPANAYSATGNLRSFIAGKVSHHFGWTGPSLTVDTACSSSSVAIHQACRAIINGECTSALAGGVNVLTSPEWFHNLAGAAFLSPSGQCKPFDAKGDGYCRGEGAGVVFLKRLSSAIADGDQVLGVIASTRVYQNLNCTAITVPNAESLSELFTDVVQQARLEPQAISVVEAHGTGTPVGDPAEYDGIRRVLGGSIRSDKLTLTAVKGLLGHTEFASGVVSLVKVLLMINEGFIPPQASFTSISPLLKAIREDRVEIPTYLKPWDVGFRAALINNYGASGSNASMVITEAPKLQSQAQISSLARTSAKSFPFWFCGFDTKSLVAYVAEFRRFLNHHSSSAKDLSISNLSFQLSRQSNRSLPQALILNAASSNDLEQMLSEFDRGDTSVSAIQPPPSRPIILCFGGQVSTYIGLSRDIYDGVVILKSHLDQCDAICLSLGLDSIYPHIFQRSPVEDTVKLQTMLFAIQYSCARAWIDSGIKVAAVVGHSFGELTGLCISGVYSLNDALKLISGRARLVRDSWGADKGSMLAVESDPADVAALLASSKKASGGESDVLIACYNGPRSFTLAGSTKSVQFTEELAKSNLAFSAIKLKKLNVTNAFHSVAVDPLMSGLEDLGREIFFKEPTIPFELATESKSNGKLSASFVAQHMRNPVFFNQAVHRIAEEYPTAIWLEAGSNSTVTMMAGRALGKLSSAHHFQAVNLASEGSFQFLVDATTNLWKQGLNVSFWAHHAKQVSDYTPVILPPYQFEKSRHWAELKEIPKFEAPVVEHVQPAEVPKGLTTFVGYQDESNQSARFRVNTDIDMFQRPTSANVVVNTAAVTPGMLQLAISLDALTNLRPDLKKFNFQPEIQGVSYHNVMVVDPSMAVYLDAISKDDEGLIWEWRLHSDSKGVTTDYSSGTIVFRPASDPHLKDNYESLARLSGRKRCVGLLTGDDVDDILQGRNIYRAFEQVVDFKEPFRHVTKIVGKDGESAGRVTKVYDGETWIDPILTECFCQVAGIFINLMTDTSDLSERGIFICDRISQWIRNPRLDSMASLPEVWEVFAVHHHESETKYFSDVFAFDSRDGSLVEAILGISYQRVSMEFMRKVVSRAVQSGPRLSTTVVSPVDTQVQLPSPPTTSSFSTPASSVKSEQKKAVSKVTKTAILDISEKTREIVCNLSGLEPEEIKDDSDLIELGIDSLMAMELVREVYATFKCTLQNEQLMDLSDFQSLVSCIRITLGLDEEENGNVIEDEFSLEAEAETEADPKSNESNGHINGINGVSGINGVNDINGVNSTNGVNGVNGTHSPNGVNGSDAKNGINSVDSHLLRLDSHTFLDSSTVRNVFREIKWTTDDAIVKGQLGTYYKEVMPRSTELCIGHIINALEQLGCPIRSATPGQRLERVSYLPKHERFMNLIYGLLDTEARLIDINGSNITRTAVAAPTKSVETLLQTLLHDEPAHAAEHKLTSLVGAQFADLLMGRQDGLQLIFGTPESREIASEMYAQSPINTIWIKQLESFLKQLIKQLPKNGEPICILEIGAGTGGTTSRVVPMLAQLGVPVKYTMTDISGSLVAAARKRFKKYSLMEFKVLNMETDPDSKLLQSQHIILATNCIHATRNLFVSLGNLNRILRPDGFLIVLEMTQQVPWVDFIFGLLEGWWLFEDGRNYVLQPATYWETILHSAGYGHVDWTEGDLPEANIQRLIVAHASGPRYERGPKPALPPAPQVALPDSEERQAVIDAYVHKYTRDFSVSLQTSPSLPSLGLETCVLVTGATGSLGSHIIANLVQDPDIHKVVCLNRLSSTEAGLRQRQAFEMRGISLDPTSMAKLKVIETDTSKPRLGLSSENYQYLVQTITHIVHSAWPMSLTRPIRTYEVQFKIARNLIDLANEVTQQRPVPFKFGFQFISSSAVIANYPLWAGKPVVPEEPGTIESLPLTGYAEAKLVTEQIIAETLYRSPDRFHAMVVRIAQISGSTSNGYWNPTEYMPFLIKSSQVLKILPDLDGTLSWYPVNGVAATLGELLMTDTATDLIYHIDNPSRQTWRDTIATLARALDIGSKNIVSYEEWVDRVRRFRGSITDNPALQLIGFFDHYFIPMSCGGLILDTAKSAEHSETLRRQGPIDSDLMMKYIAGWKHSGFLNP